MKFCLKLASALALAGLMLSAGPSATADELWSVDFEAAKKQAAEEGKDLFIEFTGSDWCPPCKALAKNVLTTDEFKTKTPEKFILVKLDNPRDKSHQSSEEQAQYKELSARYKVQGVPTIILADDQGRPYKALVGYGGDKPEAYVNKLFTGMESRDKRDALFAKAKDASGAEKAKLLSEAISVVDLMLAVSMYEDTVNEIVKLDADNSAGLKEKYESVAKNAKFKSEMQSLMSGISSQEEVAAVGPKLEELIKKLDPSGETLQEGLFMHGQILFSGGDKEGARKVFEKAIAVDPDSRMGKQIASIMDRILKQ